MPTLLSSIHHYPTTLNCIIMYNYKFLIHSSYMKYFLTWTQTNNRRIQNLAMASQSNEKYCYGTSLLKDLYPKHLLSMDINHFAYKWI
jgi:hypothetical protein